MSASMLQFNSQDSKSESDDRNSQFFNVNHNQPNRQNNYRSNHQIQNQLCVLSVLLDQNNRAFIQLIEMNERLEQRLRVVKKMYEDKKVQEQKKKYIQMKDEQFKKRKLYETTDKNSFLLQLKLFGCKQYKYQLALLQPFPKLNYKQRNFDISIKLIDSENNIVFNQNLIPITLSAYTSDQNPYAIFQNKAGQSIFKGSYQKQLHNGKAQFQKLQFRQVTSIYSKKWVYFVVYTKPPSFNYNNNDGLIGEKILHSQIRPLIISEIVVKSKKM